MPIETLGEFMSLFEKASQQRFVCLIPVLACENSRPFLLKCLHIQAIPAHVSLGNKIAHDLKSYDNWEELMVDKHFVGLSGIIILKLLEAKQGYVPGSGLVMILAGECCSFDL